MEMPIELDAEDASFLQMVIDRERNAHYRIQNASGLGLLLKFLAFQGIMLLLIIWIGSFMNISSEHPEWTHTQVAQEMSRRWNSWSILTYRPGADNK